MEMHGAVMESRMARDVRIADDTNELGVRSVSSEQAEDFLGK